MAESGKYNFQSGEEEFNDIFSEDDLAVHDATAIGKLQTRMAEKSASSMPLRLVAAAQERRNVRVVTYEYGGGHNKSRRPLQYIQVV